jgi:hypothetical protein
MNKVKITFALLAVLFATNFVSAQTKIDWKEKNRFHRTIAETFHPMEDGDFNPIRTRSGEMVKNAIAWEQSTVPEEFKSVKNIKEILQLLVKQSKSLDEKIKANVSNDTIKVDLTEIHNTFHKVVGLCTKEDQH